MEKNNCLKFIFATDPHITDKWPESRLDDYEETIFNKLSWVISLTNQLDAILLLGGDLVDKYHSKASVINKLISILKLAKNDIFGVIGNHDIYGHNSEVINEVILGTVFNSGLIKLLSRSSPVFLEKENILVQLTGSNYMPNFDKDSSQYYVEKDKNTDYAIHVVHGFLTEQHWPTLKNRGYVLISEVNTEADVVCSGHEHIGFGIKKFGDKFFTNPGALGRIKANMREINRTPQVTLLEVYKDHIEAALIEVPSVAGNKVLSREKIKEKLLRKKMLEDISYSLTQERQLCNLEEIFNDQAKLLGIDKEVLQMSRKALEEYEKSIANK